MELLDNNFENVLNQILDRPELTSKEIEVTDLDQEIIRGLITKGYLRGGNTRINSNKVFIILTYDGKFYFERKKAFLKQKRHSTIIEWIRYGITSAIAIGALIVSIFSFFKQG